MAAARTIIAISLAAAICALAVAGAPRPSFACECVARTPEEYFNDADAVFAGMVVDIDRIDDGADEDYELTFAVSQYWKGLSENNKLVTAQLDSFDGNVCGYPFQEGEEYLTYASESNGQFRVGGCYGTRPIAEVGDSLTALGAGTVPDGTVTFADPDPLDGVGTPLNAPPSLHDLVLISIIAAIVSLSAGIAVVILKKPKR